MASMAKARAIIRDGKVRIVECFEREFCKALILQGYIKDGYLDELEAAYQASRGYLSIDGADGWNAVFHLLDRCGVRLSFFLVYLDLRGRGRRVYRGLRHGTLYVRIGKGLEVLVLEEGTPVTLRSLVDWSRQVVADGFEPIIAVVDRNGGVTYYEARVVEDLS